MFRSGRVFVVVATVLAGCGENEPTTKRAPATGPAVNGGTETPPPVGSSGGGGGEGGEGTSSGSSGEPGPTNQGVDTTRVSLTVAGKARGALVAVPKSYDPNKSYPLVVVLHGDGKDGATFRNEMNVDAAAGDRAIVAYPDGTDATWNLYAPAASNPDDMFVAALVADLAGRYRIDASRVFGAGFSSGAFMTSQLACRNPSLFRAIAVHSGGAPSEPQDPSAGTWPNGYPQCPNQTSGVAALVIHGTSDNIVSYESGNYAAKYWAYVDGCTDARASTTPAPCQRHANCPSSKPVVFCPVSGLGHTVWADAARTAADFFLGM